MSLLERLQQPTPTGISLIDKLRGLIPHQGQPITQPGSQLESVLSSSRALGEQVREKVGQPLTKTIPFGKRVGEVLMSPGTELLTPRLKKVGASPFVAGAVGLGVDILAPGGGEIKTGKTFFKDLATEARKYKTAEEFVRAKTTRDGYGDDFLVHATNDEIKGDIMKFGGGDRAKKGGQSGGLFFTNKEQFADVFGKNKYYADKSLKNKVLDLSSTFEWNKIKDQIGKTYKTYDGDLSTFTKQDYDMIFPNGKNPDFATIAQYGDFFEDVIPKLGYDGIAFPEYAGGIIGKTYQFYRDNIPVYTKSQLTDIWKKAHKNKL